MIEEQLRQVIDAAVKDGVLRNADGQRSAMLLTDDSAVRIHLWTYPEPFVPLTFLQDHFGLTPRQAEAARLLMLRRTNAEIAAAMGVTIFTACRHVEIVLLKLGKTSRFAVEDIVLRAYLEQMPVHERDQARRSA